MTLPEKGVGEYLANGLYTICAKNGKDSDAYTARWTEGMHYYREDDDLWDAFVDITDKVSGVKFYTGAGAVGRDIERYYNDIVEKH